MTDTLRVIESDALRELESILPGLNYVVAFDFVHIPLIPNGKPKQYVKAALGEKAVIGGLRRASVDKMVATVEKRIRWKGDYGSHPDLSVIHSDRLTELIDQVKDHLRESAENATVWSFWLREGYPMYPVQWDVAYVIIGPDHAALFIGSSSD